MTNKDTPQSNTDWRKEVDGWRMFPDADLIDYDSIEVDDIKSFISQLLEAEKKRWREEVEGMRTKFVPADNEWFGDEDMEVGEWRLVPAKDPQKAMYCLTCKRFLHEEGCTCGTVTIDAVLQKLS